MNIIDKIIVIIGYANDYVFFNVFGAAYIKKWAYINQYNTSANSLLNIANDLIDLNDYNNDSALKVYP